MRATVAWVAVLSVAVCCGFAAAAEAEEEGFETIFNGTDLTGWDGPPDLWSVKDGVIHGETTKEKPTHGNTFCIWRGGTLEDFELRLSFRIENGNSGVQYRSKDLGKWRIAGYQAEVCNGSSVGFLYGERMRGSLCRVGQKVVIERDEKDKVVIKVVGALPDAKQAFAKYKAKGWNDYRIIARGNHIVQYLNGVQTVDCVDNDEKGRMMSGVLALQIHAGPPMVVEFKDIKIKTLKKGEDK